MRCALVVALALASCGPKASPEAPPKAFAVEADAAAPGAEPKADGVEARFVTGGDRIDPGPCTRVIVAVVRGAFEVKIAELPDTRVAPGNFLVTSYAEHVYLGGSGLALVVTSPIPGGPSCGRTTTLPELQVVRGPSTPPLTWNPPGGGVMTAHLDVTGFPEVSVGRLEGTAGVGEHVHESSWEILAAVAASGTFTLDGQPQRLAPGEIVRVPPGTKHSWTPDRGSNLVAIQIYTPPGPEQRFKALAAPPSDAGAPRDAGAMRK